MQMQRLGNAGLENSCNWLAIEQDSLSWFQIWIVSTSSPDAAQMTDSLVCRQFSISSCRKMWKLISGRSIPQALCFLMFPTPFMNKPHWVFFFFPITFLTFQLSWCNRYGLSREAPYPWNIHFPSRHSRDYCCMCIHFRIKTVGFIAWDSK